MEKRKCEICGKPFTSKSKATRCCSRACGYYLRQREKKTAKVETMRSVCVFCGKEYTKRTKQQRYCCEKCKGKAEYERAKAMRPKKQEAVCPGCGKTFLAKEGQKFCCAVCATRNRSQNNTPIGQRGGKRYVDIRITKEIPVFPELRPEVGKVYHAEASEGVFGQDVYIILIAGKKIVVRLGECVEV